MDSRIDEVLTGYGTRNERTADGNPARAVAGHGDRGIANETRRHGFRLSSRHRFHLRRRGTMTSARPWLVFSAGGFMMLALTAGTANAQTIKQETAPRVQSVAGVDTFNAYCVSCHGTRAKGDGPAAMALKKVPADLTTIAKRNGGKFSASDVEGVILGTNAMASHGSRDMPIWGPVFQALAPDPSFVKLRVANLVDYIRSIQTQ
jgi:mono/diheme cytochrome c family protein